MFKKIILYSLVYAAFMSRGHASDDFDLNDVRQDYVRTLPSPPLRAATEEQTALNATTFLLSFLGEREKDDLALSLHTINPFHALDSIQSTMMFHHYHQTNTDNFALKSERDKKIGHLYRALLSGLRHGTPLVGYLYGSAFKSAYPFNGQTQKGKVLSREVDLQERLEYEAYAYIQESLESIGLVFHIAVIRDVFHTYALDLSNNDEKIQAHTPEIQQYGQQIAHLAKETNVTVIELCDLKNIYGYSFEAFIQDHLSSLLQEATTLETCELKGLSGFLEKEYDYEKGTRKEKAARAALRAKRYVTLKQFVKRHEDRFVINSFLNIFGFNTALIPFSIHVEDYLSNCDKFPIRPLLRFKGGCNPQHQIPVLYRTSTSHFIFYSVRGDLLKKILSKTAKTSIIYLNGYKTLYCEGGLNLDAAK